MYSAGGSPGCTDLSSQSSDKLPIFGPFVTVSLSKIVAFDSFCRLGRDRNVLNMLASFAIAIRVPSGNRRRTSRHARRSRRRSRIGSQNGDFDVDGTRMTVATMKTRVLGVLEENGYSVADRDDLFPPAAAPSAMTRPSCCVAVVAGDFPGRRSAQAGVDDGLHHR